MLGAGPPLPPVGPLVIDGPPVGPPLPAVGPALVVEVVVDENVLHVLLQVSTLLSASLSRHDCLGFDAVASEIGHWALH